MYQTKIRFSIWIWSVPFCIWFENLEIDKIADQEIADIYQQVNICWLEFISDEKLWERTPQIEEVVTRGKWKWIRRTLWKPENNTPVLLLSGTLRDSAEDAVQSSPGGEVCKMS